MVVEIPRIGISSMCFVQSAIRTKEVYLSFNFYTYEQVHKPHEIILQQPLQGRFNAREPLKEGT
jgi:hypothetical protein